MRYGYVRVSTKEQDLQRQIEALLNKGVEETNIFIEFASGKDFNRPVYKKLIDETLTSGDELFITSLDRLGRNLELNKREIEKIIKIRKCSIYFVEQPFLNFKINQDKIQSNLLQPILLQILSFMAEWERDLMLVRQRQAYNTMERDLKGRMISNKTGKVLGRREKIKELTKEEKQLLKSWIDGNIGVTSVAKILGITKPTLYKIKRQYENNEIKL